MRSITTTFRNETERKVVAYMTIIQQKKQLAAELELNKELQKKVETLTLEAARKIQSEHDKAESKLVKMEKRTITTIDGKEVEAPAAVTDAPTGYWQGIVSLVNNQRVRENKRPFATYQEFLDAPKEEPERNITWTKSTDVNALLADPVTPLDTIITDASIYGKRPLLAGGEVYCIASEGYYIGWNKSRCYIQQTLDNEVNILVRGDRLYGADTRMTILPNDTFRDLTREEVDSIIKGKPSYSKLFEVFSKFQNHQNVQLDITKAIPVW